MALSAQQEKDVTEMAAGLRRSIAALEALKDGVNRSATIADEKQQLTSLEKQLPKPAPATPTKS
jgi:transcriptional regulator of NAD metabolism